MIEEEVKKILNRKSASIKAGMIGNLTDEFRSGRNLTDLLKLIDSQDKDVIWVGIYIISEVPIKNRTILKFIIERLQTLVEHNDSKIRYDVLINLGTLLEEIDPNEAKKLYLKMSQDSDDVVRATAEKILHTGKLY